MILGFLSLVTAALFAGAAFYVNFAEQPARLALNDRAALIHLRQSYERAAMMQAGLAILGFALGLAAPWWEGRDGALDRKRPCRPAVHRLAASDYLP